MNRWICAALVAAMPATGMAQSAGDVLPGLWAGPAIGQGVIVPPGYRRAWEDRRENPARGPRTAAGDAQMAAVWTDETPMRAVHEIDRGAELRGPSPAWVDSGLYATYDQARAVADRVDRSAGPVSVGQGTVTGQFRVLFGPYANADLARRGLDAAHEAGLTPIRIRN